jgi:hypothetical protein
MGVLRKTACNDSFLISLKFDVVKKTTGCWEVAPCCSDDGGNKYLRNAGTPVPDYTAQHSHLHTRCREKVKSKQDDVLPVTA